MTGHRASIGKCFVRILRERANGFVEFEFSINDEDLTIELILPRPAFDEFCARHEVTFLSSPASDGSPDQMSREPGHGSTGRTGLYRAPEEYAENH